MEGIIAAGYSAVFVFWFFSGASRGVPSRAAGGRGELFGTSIGEPTMGDGEVVSASRDR